MNRMRKGPRLVGIDRDGTPYCYRTRKGKRVKVLARRARCWCCKEGTWTFSENVQVLCGICAWAGCVPGTPKHPKK